MGLGAAVADVDPTVVGPADQDRLREHWDALEALAAAHGITQLRWDPGAAELTGSFGTLGLTDEFAFKADAARLVGRAVNIRATDPDHGRQH